MKLYINTDFTEQIWGFLMKNWGVRREKRMFKENQEVLWLAKFL